MPASCSVAGNPSNAPLSSPIRSRTVPDLSPTIPTMPVIPDMPAMPGFPFAGADGSEAAAARSSWSRRSFLTCASDICESSSRADSRVIVCGSAGTSAFGGASAARPGSAANATHHSMTILKVIVRITAFAAGIAHLPLDRGPFPGCLHPVVPVAKATIVAPPGAARYMRRAIPFRPRRRTTCNGISRASVVGKWSHAKCSRSVADPWDARFRLLPSRNPMPAAARARLPSSRPKVCLVLSGGGARGAAHIGVLKVLEELRVPIDCIAGTSMGSLVGGAYASGMSIADMERARRRHLDRPPVQGEAAAAGPGRSAASSTIARSCSAIELGVRDGQILLPKGVVSGVQLETVLRRLSKIGGFHKFDELPIPFRAVATDLVTGKPVVFSEGELANVMRASMSVPGAIAPAEIDGQLLVDGGLTNNLPGRRRARHGRRHRDRGQPRHAADEARGAHLRARRYRPDDQHPDRAERAGLARLAEADRHPDPAGAGRFLGRRTSTTCSKTVPIGEAAARAAQARLSALSVPPEQYAALRARQSQPAAPDLRPVDEIRFDAMSRVNADVLAPTLETKPGQPLDPEMLDRDMRRLFGTGDFEHVNYRVIEEPGRRVLNVDAVEKSWGPNYLRFGLGLGVGFQRRCVLQRCSRATARPGSTRSARNGAPTCRSGSTNRS